MEDLLIEETKYTPEIKFLASGELNIVGKSYPENTFEFYKPIMKWIEDYFAAGKKELTLNMEIIYFNSSSSKLFFDMFDLIEANNNEQIVVNWIYDEDNESSLEAGEDFKEDFEDLQINLITKD